MREPVPPRGTRSNPAPGRGISSCDAGPASGTRSNPALARVIRRAAILLLYSVVGAAALFAFALWRHDIGARQAGRPVVAPLPFAVRDATSALPSQQTQPTPLPQPTFRKMSGPKRVPVGSYVTVRGTLGSGISGPVVVEARWRNEGWRWLATSTARGGRYMVRYRLLRRGSVRVRIALPDGDYAVATISVTSTAGST
jgi:hypothetical protein